MPRSGDIGLLAEFRRSFAGVERWLLPPACLLCDAPVPAGEGDALVCGICRSRWRPVSGPVCPRCGQSGFADLECRLCATWPTGLTRARSAVWLLDGSRDAVHRLKYQGWWRIAESLAEAMRYLEPLTGQ